MKKIKKILYVIASLSVLLFSVPTFAAQQESTVIYNEISDIQPRTDITQWRYKVENGNLYKRLYNYTRNRWETDWIFVMSGVEEL